jgi:hypothetical protein
LSQWRTAVGLIAGIFLVLPLLWVLGLAHPIYFYLQDGGGTRVRLVPRLHAGEGVRLQTYQQPCQNDADCELPLSCFIDLRDGRRSCRDSRCVTDADCSPDFTCQSMLSLSRTAVLRTCIPVGVRKAGEECDAMPSHSEEACERGLRCERYCGSPCQPNQPESCADGFFCKDSLAGALCWPSCRERGCPEGQHCIDRGDSASLCARVEGPDCLQSPCPGEQRCAVMTKASRPQVAWTKCSIDCGAGKPDCPEGMLCFLGRFCVQPCESQEPNTCPPGQSCRVLFPDTPRICAFDLD